MKNAAINAFDICSHQNIGPVHINIPFEKPLEPDSFTDEIEEKILLESLPDELTRNLKQQAKLVQQSDFKRIADLLRKNKNGLITVGAGHFSDSFFSLIENFSVKFSLPVFADASSGLKFKTTSFIKLNI